jgi:hypothetical protein
MPKKRDDPISAEDLAEYLAAQSGDFQLELFAYREAKARGLTVSHGGTYEDPVTKKVRQYDVRAYKVGAGCRVDLAIECKSLKASYPLLLSRIPRAPEESFHELVYSCREWALEDGDRLVPSTARSVRVQLGDSIYPRGAYVAKATAQVGRNDRQELVSGDSDVFDKWSQALASSHDLVTAAADYRHKYRRENFATFVIPMLVVPNGTLWAADYSEDGELQGAPYQIDEGLMFVGREYYRPRTPPLTISHLHFSTQSNLGTLLRGIGRDEELWRSFFPPEAVAQAVAAQGG